ncbi:MAG TPA: DMT family transporter [Acidimicrobiales bacterium]|nr:DMT family transporter [Acidimicrobiales bacterium]
MTERPHPAPDAVGCAFAGAAALSYAATIVIGHSLSRAGVPSATALGIRFGVAALAIGAVLVVRRAPLLPAAGERVRLALLGGVGYSLESTLFFLALGHATAAGAALVFYVYPGMVAAVELGLGAPLPLRRMLLAVGLSAAGTLAVVASGSRVAISPAGVAFALGAAAVFAAYLISGSRFVRTTDAWTRAAWVAGGAAVSSTARGLLTGSFSLSTGHRLELLAYGAFTATAFGLMFTALQRLGPARTAVVMTLEAFFAVVLGAAFLGEGLAPTQVAGGVGILVAATVVAFARAPGSAAPVPRLAAPVDGVAAR